MELELRGLGLKQEQGEKFSSAPWTPDFLPGGCRADRTG